MTPRTLPIEAECLSFNGLTWHNPNVLVSPSTVLGERFAATFIAARDGSATITIAQQRVERREQRCYRPRAAEDLPLEASTHFQKGL